MKLLNPESIIRRQVLDRVHAARDRQDEVVPLLYHQLYVNPGPAYRSSLGLPDWLLLIADRVSTFTTTVYDLLHGLGWKSKTSDELSTYLRNTAENDPRHASVVRQLLHVRKSAEDVAAMYVRLATELTYELADLCHLDETQPGPQVRWVVEHEDNHGRVRIHEDVTEQEMESLICGYRSGHHAGNGTYSLRRYRRTFIDEEMPL